MNHVNFFKDLFESIPDYRKKLLMFLIKKNDDLLIECVYSKDHVDRLCLKFKNI